MRPGRPDFYNTGRGCMNTGIIRHGFVLILLALISGLFIQAMPIPRLGLSAHTIGILSGVLLLAIGAVWPSFVLSVRQKRLMYWSWVYSSYMNWLGCLLGAVTGAGRSTPIASDGVVGAPVADAVVGMMLLTVVIASFIAAGLSIFGLRSGVSNGAENST